MQTYDVIVIGFGKAGKTLAAKLAGQGKSVAMVEKDATMYGGTCINIGCIPTKVLVHATQMGHDFTEAMAEKTAVVERLRAKNFAMLDGAPTADVYNASAKFVANKVIEITSGSETKLLTAEVIVINTGSVPNLLPIAGLSEAEQVYDSTGIQNLKEQPKRLGIIGGGNIGLEFANIYAQLGSQVTVFDPQKRIFAREEAELSHMAQGYMEEQGVQFQLGTVISNVSNRGQAVVITTELGDFEYDAVLHATGRRPNTDKLGLENTDIVLTERGAIEVDDFCQTSVPNVFAVGDVNGGLQFTYVSLDDFRIVYGYLNGDSSYSRRNRHHVPNATFINPPLARVGIDEATAKEKGLNYKANSLPVAGMPRGHVNGDLRGMYKVVVDADSQEILGATLFGQEAHELINLITMAMDNHIPYTYFQKQIFTHPTMAENLNDVFNL
ncbi:FAD-containing oxidoreductase [Streptococcus dentasini]